MHWVSKQPHAKTEQTKIQTAGNTTTTVEPAEGTGVNTTVDPPTEAKNPPSPLRSGKITSHRQDGRRGATARRSDAYHALNGKTPRTEEIDRRVLPRYATTLKT
jgi:hypothetical protein